ncbi:MAG: M42 family metallopeptidase [Tissierellales bacterium]|nr:M42 family metallopeptidase [Tissierellales bacterium]
MIDSNLLKNMVSIYGPSSREERIRNLIIKEIEEYVDEIKIDQLGNLIAHKAGCGDKLMISANMDQLGFIVIDIDEKGFIRFTNIGKCEPIHLIGQRVQFENGIKGVIFYEENSTENKITFEKLYIDIGSNKKEDTLSKVNIGDICILANEYIENEITIISPNLDDRLGCYILVEVIKNLNNTEYDLYFVFTTQGKVGARGAKTAAFSIEPDISLVIDVNRARDTPKQERSNVKLFNGVTIDIMNNSYITHSEIKNTLLDLVVKNNIKYQLEVSDDDITDAGSIHLSKYGVKTTVVSIPCRYVHTSSEIATKEDIIMCLKLINSFIGKL